MHTKTFILTLACSLLAASTASAAEADVSVTVPDTLTIAAAKNFTENQMDLGSAVGGCRRVSQRTVRCGVYSERSRRVATVKIRDGAFSISIA